MKSKTLNNYAYLGNNRALAFTYFGRRIILDTRNIQHYSIISHGVYEKGVAWAIEKYLKPGHTMVDIGANIGFFTLLGNHIVGPQGKVYSLEPNPDIFDLMQSSVHVNAFRPRSERLNVAAFNQEGILQLTWSPAKHGGGRLITHDKIKHDEKTAEVPTKTLDSLIKSEDLPVDVIKIDTEGSEFYALQGAQEVLDKSPHCVIITEWNPKFLKARGSSVDEAIDFIAKRFKIIERIIKVDTVERVNPEDLKNIPHTNLILRN
ncbi:FkbM family methyltransferase [Marinicella sp. W31]|uniref:FkbM family methyltransferase n=1 Tax=Marinicella sp. W31 TaxID=3023713 RepID=UPI0037582F44